MYDELIKRLNKYSAEHEHHCGITAEAADAIEELSRENESLAKSVNEASEILRRRWIPVTERVPGREWVLCKCRVKIHEVLSLRDGYWYHDPQHQYMSGFVTHWMPLPEPPKEE